jgi:hypothetical protein
MPNISFAALALFLLRHLGEIEKEKTRSHKSMLFDPDSKKNPYSSPTMTKLTLEQAKQFLREATDVLESLRREQDTRKPKIAASGKT